ncbi:MAG: SDR family oxidoreductase [Leucobacter sp.]
MLNEVLVVIGTGGMGVSSARRVGSGKTLLLADFNESALEEIAETLRDEGQQVETQVVDVSSRESVEALARRAAELGPVRHVVHTAGLSPAQAPAEAILRVDLVGVALVLEAFEGVIAVGGSGVVISSSSAHMAPPLAPEDQALLASAPIGELLGLPLVAAASADAGYAYMFSKLANQYRVRHASLAWGARGARVNTISPGIISTKMGRQELSGESGAGMRAMVEGSSTGRLGSPDDIAAAVEFLLSDAAALITGTDLLVDGGVVAGVKSGRVDTSALGSMRED